MASYANKKLALESNQALEGLRLKIELEKLQLQRAQLTTTTHMTTATPTGTLGLGHARLPHTPSSSSPVAGPSKLELQPPLAAWYPSESWEFPAMSPSTDSVTSWQSPDEFPNDSNLTFPHMIPFDHTLNMPDPPGVSHTNYIAPGGSDGEAGYAGDFY